VYPGLHVQSAGLSLICGEFEFAGHDLHTSEAAPVASEYFPAMHMLHNAAPGDVLNVPTAQKTQSPPLDPVKPALHVQASFWTLASGELEFAGHEEHTAGEVANRASE